MKSTSIVWTAVQLLFNNFSITFKEVSLPWLKALRWFSVVYYAFESLAVIEFGGTQVGRARGARRRRNAVFSCTMRLRASQLST